MVGIRLRAWATEVVKRKLSRFATKDNTVRLGADELGPRPHWAANEAGS